MRPSSLTRALTFSLTFSGIPGGEPNLGSRTLMFWLTRAHVSAHGWCDPVVDPSEELGLSGSLAIGGGLVAPAGPEL